MAEADEYYLEARDAVLDAVRQVGRKRAVLRTGDGMTIRINLRTPLRIYLAMIYRRAPGEEGPGTSFNFQRNGRVDVGGSRKVPLRDALTAGHDPWASREELLELATQIRSAVPHA
jgi:hypothetical protein